MNREAKEEIMKLCVREIEEAQAQRAALLSSSQEIGKKPMPSGKWEDLKPREIAHLDRIITEYEALRRETAAISI